MVPEAPLRSTDAGLVPDGEGWFVVNACDSVWKTGEFGAYTRFEGDARFSQIGEDVETPFREGWLPAGPG